MAKKILIVDDNKEFVESNKDLLEAHGYEVVAAYDGESGLELAQKEKPDLMILDVMMATKSEGFDVSRRIPKIPELRNMEVIMVTGVRQEMKLPFSFEPDETWLPVARYLEKPIDPEKLMAEIEKLLSA